MQQAQQAIQSCWRKMFTELSLKMEQS